MRINCDFVDPKSGLRFYCEGYNIIEIYFVNIFHDLKKSFVQVNLDVRMQLIIFRINI